MKRTFTFLFVALFAFVGVWAQLPVTSTAPAEGQWNADTKWYTLKVKNGYVSLHNADGNANLMLSNGTLSKNAQSLWCVVGSEAEGYQFYNLASGTSKVLGATGSDNTGRMTMYDAAGGVDGVTYRFDIKAKEGNNVNAFVKKQGDNNEWWNDRGGYLSYWKDDAGYGDDGSKCVFGEVDLADFVADYKTSAKSALDVLHSLFAVEVADAKAAVDAVTATGVDAFAAVDAAIEANMPEVPQYLTFRNGEVDVTSSRYENYLTANMATGKGYGTPDFSALNATWTLKYSGGFCLYNEANGVYLGAPVANGALSKAPIALYTFKVIEGNKVELKANGQTLHLNNHSGNFLSSYPNDPASCWYVETYDYKAELAELIQANENNHAVEPALGQYPTAAYNALVEANETATTIVEVAEAIAAFKAAKNLPVFTIDGVIDYAAGKSIYDNPGSVNGKGNTHYFKATNNYDKTMWWALDMTTASLNNVGKDGITVGITNIGTEANFWNSPTIKITETSENDGNGIVDDGIFLFYTTGNDTPIHAQNDGQLICRYGDKGASTGSAWKFTYIGNSYDLGKVTDEHIAALAKLQARYNANEGLKDVTIGTALGLYSGSKDDLVAALAAAKEILAEDVVEMAKMEVSAIEAAEAAVVAGAAKITFNVPVDGKYYRIMAVSGWNDDARYLGSKNSTAKDGRAEFVAEVDTNTIFLFQGSYLKNYATDLYLVSNSNFLGYNGKQDAGSKIAFYAASNGLAGAFNISFNEDARWLYCHKDNYTDAGGRGTENGYCFNIEEVQETELLALKALRDEFTNQAAEFAKLGNGEALSVLLAIKEQQWVPANTTVQALVAKINNNELVLKSEVEEAMGIMESFGYLIMEYTDSYAPAVKEAQGLLAQLEKDSDDYEYLAEGLGFFATATVDDLSTASFMLNQRVKYLCDIDAKEVTVGTEYVEAYETWSGENNPLLANSDLKGYDESEVYEEDEDGNIKYDENDEPIVIGTTKDLTGWGFENATAFDFANGVVTFAPQTAEASTAYIRQSVSFDPGQYRLTGKAYHQGASNAKLFVGEWDYTDWRNPVFVVVYEASIPEATAFGADLQFEFELDEEVGYTIGYSCDFEGANASMVVGGLKLEMIERTETPSLREEFQKIYNGGDAYMGVVDFSNLKEMTPYSSFEAMHPAYEALFEEVTLLNEAMFGGKVLKSKVEKAIKDMKAKMAEFEAVADYLMTEEYWNTTQDALEAIDGYMEESSVYAQLMEAYSAAMGVVYDEKEVDGEIEVMTKYYATFTSVDDIEAALDALAEELEAAEAKIPDAITLDIEEAELSDNQRTIQLEATVKAESENADMSIFWVSDDEEVATVDENGLVTAVGEGEAYIIAYSIHKNVSAKCEVTVTALTDGIDNFEVKVETVIYDIHGRQVEKMEKGFYIVNGKKVLVK